MKSTIHKVTLGLVGVQQIYAHRDIKPLSVQLQNGSFCLWYQTSTELPSRQASALPTHLIHVVGTGHMLPAVANVYGLEYISTVQDGEMVWHFYFERAH